MPLQRRVPKFGFKNINRVEYKAVNIASLEMLATEKGITEFTVETFLENGLTSSNDLVKVLGRGELKSKITVSAHGFSKAAIAAIEAQGGVCTKI
jgi:large subunit ribosomal protein L15